jgi:hypothetical protein
MIRELNDGSQNCGLHTIEPLDAAAAGSRKFY